MRNYVYGFFLAEGRLSGIQVFLKNTGCQLCCSNMVLIKWNGEFIFVLIIITDYNVHNAEGAKYVGRQKLKEFNKSELYNLDNATELYKEFLHKFRKNNYTNNLDYTVHFYRFIKTLVELNKNNFDGNGTTKLDENADVIIKPDEYFY